MDDKRIYFDDRMANIDRLRILAVVGIVWFHTEGVIGRSIGYAGLPIFLLVFYSLIITHSHNRSIGEFFNRRAQRLLIPWLFWCGVYAFCKVAKAIAQGQPAFNFLQANSIFFGTHIHLWYIPYAFVCGSFVYLLNRLSYNVATVIIFALVGVILLSVCSIAMSSVEIPIPLRQWVFGLPALPLGFAIGQASGLLPKRHCQGFMLMLATVTITGCLTMMTLGYRQLLVPYSIGVPLVCAAYIWRGHQDRFSEYVASLTYGIYLIHPLVGYLLVVPFFVFGLSTWMNIPACFALSATLTAVLKRMPLKQFV